MLKAFELCYMHVHVCIKLYAYSMWLYIYYSKEIDLDSDAKGIWTMLCSVHLCMKLMFILFYYMYIYVCAV